VRCNWSIKWTHFAVLNTDVEAFLNQLFTTQLYNVGIQLSTATYAKLAFIITENIHNN